MSINSILNISDSGLSVAQSALQTVSHNIANVDTPGYTRQVSKLQSSPMGMGVQVTGIAQKLDPLLDRREELGTSETGSLDAQSRYLTQVEQTLNETGTSTGLSSQLDALYTAADNLVNNPTDPVGKENLVTQANGLTQQVQGMSSSLSELLTQADREVDVTLTDVNTKLKVLQGLNAQIAASGPNADISDLKDQQRQAVLDLGKEINIQTLPMPNGVVQVMMAGGQGLLCDSVHAATLARSKNKAIDPTQPTAPGQPPVLTNFAGITLDGRDVQNVQGGELGGLLVVRDTLINGKNGFLTQLNSLSDEIRFQFNTIGSTAVSQSMYTSQTGTASMGNDFSTPVGQLVTNPTAANYSGAPPDLSRVGSGQIVFATGPDATHLTVSAPINVTNQMSLSSLVQAINANGSVTASITPGHQLCLQAPTGQVYGVVSDGSNLLAALGVGGLFGGTGAQDMTVNSALVSDPSTVGTGRIATVANDPANPGQITGATFDDGSNQAMLSMSGLRTTKFVIPPGSGTPKATLTDSYAATVGDVGSVVSQNTQSMTAQTSAQSFLDSLRQSTSGVSREEELTDLLKYQRAFQASSKMISYADQLMQSVVSMV